LDPDTKKWVRIHGEVVRVAKDATISNRFGKLRETTRDQILRALFRRYNAFLREQKEQSEEGSETRELERPTSE
ncbi:MAG TPA: hypothetical protein VMW69_09825, partial [Spirochaetia bacterium]|nr:hypothetical protein [Spirochaetia bacterium]